MYHHFRLLHFTLRRELGDIYATIFLKTFAISLITIFVPLYLLNDIGTSFHGVLYYLIAVYVFILIGYIFGSLLSYRLKVKYMFLVSIPFFVLYFLLLYNLNFFNIPIVLLGAIFGLADGFFWFAYNTDFARYSDRVHRGEEVKFWYIAASAIGIIGPFLGGVLLSWLGFYAVFSVVILLFVVSILPLVNLKEKKMGYKISLNDVFRKDNYVNSGRYALQGFRTLISGVFWPIFVFFIVGQYFTLGIVFSVSALVASFVIWIIGNNIDRIDRRLFADFSSIIHGIVSFLKVFITSITQVFTVGVLSFLTSGVSQISLNALAFDQANKTKIMGFFVFREIVLLVSRILILVIILVAGLDMMASLKLGFILLAGTSLFQKFI